MLSLAAPGWLLGLALLPLIRWLHRGGRHRRALPVAHLGLWRGAVMRSPAVGQAQPPDPAWRRRALLTALLLLALAGPQLPAPPRPVTLWVDDSLSMLTREAQGTRLALALAQAEALLAERPGAEVEVRALGDPWQRLGAPGAPAPSPSPTSVAAAAALEVRIAASAGAEAAAPPAALLRTDREHWLLTDGAHSALQQWPDGRSADRVVQVGEVTLNVGLATLAARRSPQAAARADVLVKLSNGGNAVETRELVVYSGDAEASRSSHHLAPGASVLVAVQVAATDRVRATLQPGDALAADDQLQLDLSPLRPRRVAVDASCPAALQAAVSTHPGLSLAAPDGRDAAAALECGGAALVGRLPTLRVRDGDSSRWPPDPVQWSAALPASQRVQVESGQLPVAASLKPQPGDTVLLALGDEPVIVVRAGATPRVETSLDFGALATARGSQTPLLVNLMFERLWGGRLLGEVVTSGRGAAASHIVPGAQPAAAVQAPAQPSQTAMVQTPQAAGPRPLAQGMRPVLLIAVLALLWEIAALGRQWARLGRQPQAGPV